MGDRGGMFLKRNAQLLVSFATKFFLFFRKVRKTLFRDSELHCRDSVSIGRF
jgi:hypothetical protein